MMHLKKTVWKIAGVVLFLSETGIATGQVADGFLGIKWGTPLSQLQNSYELVSGRIDGSYRRYSCKIRRVEDAEVNDCDLEFIAGKFAGVALITGDSENSHRLLAYLQQLFGEGHRTDSRGYQWFSGRVHVAYDETASGEGFVYWYCHALQPGQDVGPISGDQASAHPDYRP
jgi:hypothetical protein